METIDQSVTLPTMVRPDQFKHNGFMHSFVHRTPSLVSLLGEEFARSTYVNSNHSADNFQYVSWQLRTNKSSLKLVKSLSDDLALFQVGQSPRHYLVNLTNGHTLAIQKRY